LVGEPGQCLLPAESRSIPALHKQEHPSCNPTPPPPRPNCPTQAPSMRLTPPAPPRAKRTACTARTRRYTAAAVYLPGRSTRMAADANAPAATTVPRLCTPPWSAASTRRNSALPPSSMLRKAVARRLLGAVAAAAKAAGSCSGLPRASVDRKVSARRAPWPSMAPFRNMRAISDRDGGEARDGRCAGGGAAWARS
jgi:hypothetical protein